MAGEAQHGGLQEDSFKGTGPFRHKQQLRKEAKIGSQRAQAQHAKMAEPQR